MNNDFIQNAVNNLYQANELMALKAENARLQAEVEHLTSENLLVREESDRHYKLWVRRGYQLNKLRKLGTEMGKHLPDTDAANRVYIHFEAEGVE